MVDFGLNEYKEPIVLSRLDKLERFALWKHAYSNILKISRPKTESFQIKILIFFIFLLKTYIVGTR